MKYFNVQRLEYRRINLILSVVKNYTLRNCKRDILDSLNITIRSQSVSFNILHVTVTC